jgi:dihydrofolate synthase/folylpolyglutamate synthase
MRFTNEADALTYIFRSMRKLRPYDRGLDEHTRDINPTRRLLAHHLLDTPREYAVVTGSKGKGSTTAITAKLLQHLGHRVGMLTSPHLVSWRERIRVNGRCIPEADFLRILSDLAPDIDAIEAALVGEQYFSPQGIFLALALRWFDEQAVNVAVLEVGRGGRFDDVSVAPNKLALFTPIMLEHTGYLGDSLERIAWHKAGIIKPYSYAYSQAQDPAVMEVLQTEAEALGAEFNWIAPADAGEYRGPAANGMRVEMGRYGEVTLPLLGRYEIANAALAVIGAGNLHGRLAGIPHGSPEYVERIRAGLAAVVWPGRCQKLQDHPAIYLDGAITVPSAQSFVESLEGRLQPPVITIIGVPVDRDYAGVYQVLAPISQGIILTETGINIKIRFPEKGVALAAARRFHPDVSYANGLPLALERATARAGRDGTIVMAVAQPLVGEALQLWNLSFETI